MVAEMVVLPYRTRSRAKCDFRSAHEYNIMFKLAEGDYYHVPAAQVQQICPELQATVDEAVENGTAMTHVFEIPRSLEREWKDWWTINDYIEQGKRPQRCELTTYEPISSFLTDAHVHILATRYNLHAGAEAAVAATQDRAAEILDCFTDMESIFDPHVALLHLESLIAAARVACSDGEEQPHPAEEEEEESSGGAVGAAEERATGAGRTGLRAMVAAACVTLGPLLAELPALRGAIFQDAAFAAMWERLSRGGLAPFWFTPEVRERVRCVVEGHEIKGRPA